MNENKIYSDGKLAFVVEPFSGGKYLIARLDKSNGERVWFCEKESFVKRYFNTQVLARAGFKELEFDLDVYNNIKYKEEK